MWSHGRTKTAPIVNSTPLPPARKSASAKHSAEPERLIPINCPLLRREKIEFPRSLLVEERAFGLVAAAPMLVAARNSNEISGADTLFTGVILIEIGSLDDNQPHVARM